jgi:hypothetical protein
MKREPSLNARNTFQISSQCRAAVYPVRQATNPKS